MAKIEPKLIELSKADEQSTYEPIVLNLKKQKKRRRRYSKGLGEIGRMERHLTRATHRMSKGLEEGARYYRKNSQKSSRKKRNGALRDLAPNAGLAVSRAMKESSRVPYDLSRAVNTKGTRRLLRRQLRLVSRGPWE